MSPTIKQKISLILVPNESSCSLEIPLLSLHWTLNLFLLIITASDNIRQSEGLDDTCNDQSEAEKVRPPVAAVSDGGSFTVS